MADDPRLKGLKGRAREKKAIEILRSKSNKRIEFRGGEPIEVKKKGGGGAIDFWDDRTMKHSLGRRILGMPPTREK